MDPLNQDMKNLLSPDEVVKYIPNFEHLYIISNKGRVFSEKKGSVYVTLKGERYTATVYKELKTFYVRGYKAVCLSQQDKFTVRSKRKNYYIHELLVTTFLGGYNKYFFRIRHVNKKKDDNRLENLKLEFRKKNDKDFIEDYKRQQRMLALLKDYSTDTE